MPVDEVQAPTGARGRGRPRVLSTPQVRYVRRAHAAGVSVAAMARQLGCGRATVHRALTRTI